MDRVHGAPTVAGATDLIEFSFLLEEITDRIIFIVTRNFAPLNTRGIFEVMKAYREEIDGMRAVAVMSVILFHAGFTCCPGGYIGVDVFFVISGYLITSIIVTEHDQGRFSLIHFYERRARRILPALFIVLFCSVPFAYSYLRSDQLSDFAQALISITLCSSNVFFWMKEDYFNKETELNPLVHTWSLAVEEQFYILFSLLFVLFAHSQRRLIRSLLVVISVISLVLAQWSGNLQLTYPFISRDPLWFSQRDWSSFYLLTGRMWELLFGGLAFLYQQQPSLEKRFYREIGAVLGLVLILIAIFGFDKNTPSPSFYTLIPICGTVLLLLCADPSTWTGRMLSLKVFTTIGLCSYSAYLWHQPLLAFAKMSTMEQSLSLLVRVGLVVLSLGLAYISWRFVERPFRNKVLFTRKQILVFTLAGILVVDATGLILMKTDRAGIPFYPSSASKYSTLNSTSNDYLSDAEYAVKDAYINKRFVVVRKEMFYDKNSTLRRLAVIGDSHAKDFLNMVAENNALANYQIRMNFIDYRCQMYIGKEDRASFLLAKDRAFCHDAYELKQAKPLIDQSDVIILTSDWRMWAAQRINETVMNLQLRKNQTLFVLGAKAFSTANPILYRNMSYRERQKLRSGADSYYPILNDILAKQLNPGIFVNIFRFICGEHNSCPVFTPEDRLYASDGSHATESGARFIGALIFSRPPLNRL